MSSISGNKDTDRSILLHLSDKDLRSSYCINKYFYYFVCDDNFFYSKLLKSYPNTLKFFSKIKYETYKEFYFLIVCCIFKLQKEFNYFYVAGNPIEQYKTFNYSQIYQETYEKRIQEMLYITCGNGEIELVKEAVKRGADIHRADEYALVLASKYGYLDIVKYLIIENGADVHAFFDHPFVTASRNGHLEILKYFVSLGPDIPVRADIGLGEASKNGHYEIVKYLMSLGARNEDALIYASEKGHLRIVKYLLEYTPPISTRNLMEYRKNIDSAKDKALQTASANGHKDVVKYLVEYSPPISPENLVEYSPPISSIAGNLVEKGPNISADDDQALRWASKNGHLKVVKYLVKKGANIHCKKRSSIKIC